MSDVRAPRRVVLDRLPAQTLRAAVVYLDDVRRECQLVVAGAADGVTVDPALVEVATGLIPDIEEIGDSFRAASLATNDDGSLLLEGEMALGQSATLANLQIQLIQLRLLGRRGGLLIDSDPEVSQLLAWVWEEIADQLYSRPARPYRAAT